MSGGALHSQTWGKEKAKDDDDSAKGAQAHTLQGLTDDARASVYGLVKAMVIFVLGEHFGDKRWRKKGNRNWWMTSKQHLEPVSTC